MVMVPKKRFINNNAVVISKRMRTFNIKEFRTVKFTQSFYNTSTDVEAINWGEIF